MREECKHYESRTYANGDTARRCKLLLAPDAPWRCPENCPKYERRMVDAGWIRGSLVSPPTPEDPPGLDDGSAAAVLDQAAEFLNSIGAEIIAEVDEERRKIANRPKNGKKKRYKKK